MTCRVGSLSIDTVPDPEGGYRHWDAYFCSCGWRVRCVRARLLEARDLALDHQLGRVETKVVPGFLPVVTLDHAGVDFTAVPAGG